MKFFKIPIVLLLGCLFLTTCTPNHNITFLNEPLLEPVGDNLFELQRNFKAFDGHRTIIVPKGFVTDFASIPRIFWPVLNPVEFKTIPPAILHDFMYSCPNDIPRAEADSIFYSALIDNLVNPVKAYAYYLAVRIAGFRYYNKDNHCEFTHTPEKKVSY